jgi:hypothetical protein
MSADNSNCLDGIRCRQCGNASAFYIEALILAFVTDAGTEPADSSSMSWDADSHTQCAECDADGKLRDFTTPSPGKE